jgi:hypothetical protein
MKKLVCDFMEDGVIEYKNSAEYPEDATHLVFGQQIISACKIQVKHLTVVSDNDTLEIKAGSTLVIQYINNMSVVANTDASIALRSYLSTQFNITYTQNNLIMHGPALLNNSLINQMYNIYHRNSISCFSLFCCFSRTRVSSTHEERLINTF